MHRRKMLYAWSIVLTLNLAALNVEAAFEFQGIGWPAAGANIRIIGDDHPQRYLVNPSLMGVESPGHLTIQFQQPFRGLGLEAGALAYTYGIGQDIPCIVGVEYFGDEIYSELSISNGASRLFGQALQPGVSLNYLQVQILDFATRRALTLSPSFTINLGESFRLGSVLQHLIQSGSRLTIPQKFLLGSEFSADKVTLLLALEKEAALNLEVCAAMLFCPSSNWQLAMGYRSLSQSASAGWRLKKMRYGLNYSVVFYPDLPPSHGFGVEFFLL